MTRDCGIIKTSRESVISTFPALTNSTFEVLNMAKASLPFSISEINPTVEVRLWSKVHKTDSCWVWIAKHNVQGYGRIKVGGRPLLAHRLSFAIAHGRMPSGHVLHSCDNPPCVNPAHLREGTDQDNRNDRAERGSLENQIRGSAVKVSKLKESDIPNIRKMLSQGISQATIAEIYSVSQVAISCIALRRTWRHV